MDCETVRRLLEEGEANDRVAAHLDQCAACRSEAEFVRGITAAVAAMPRGPAPEGFAALVMAGVRRQAASQQPAAWPTRLALRRWELGSIATLCLALLALIPTALRRWSVVGGRSSVEDAAAWFSAWERDLIPSWQSISHPLSAWIAASMPWLYGAAPFALLLYLVLSWRPGEGSLHGAEDAHA